MATIQELVQFGTERLRQAEVAESPRDSRRLLLHILGKDLSYYYSHGDENVSRENEERFLTLISRREKREPLQHILGFQEFFGREFEVNSNVLVPRPETEILISETLRHFSPDASVSFLDVGTGSGCIALTLLKEMRNAKGSAADISMDALKVAKRNSEHLGVSERINFIESDLFSEVPKEEFDLIVSNPPYVSLADFEQLEPEVNVYDPKEAVTDSSDGLSIIARIASEAFRFLKPNGLLLIEFGFGQAEGVADLFSRPEWTAQYVVNDLAQIPRLFVARKAS